MIKITGMTRGLFNGIIKESITTVEIPEKQGRIAAKIDLAEQVIAKAMSYYRKNYLNQEPQAVKAMEKIYRKNIEFKIN